MRINEVITTINLDHQMGLTPLVITEPEHGTIHALREEFTEAVVLDAALYRYTFDLVNTLSRRIDLDSEEQQTVIIANVDDNTRLAQTFCDLAVTGQIHNMELRHQHGHIADLDSSVQLLRLPEQIRFVLVSEKDADGETDIEDLLLINGAHLTVRDVDHTTIQQEEI